MPAKKRSATTEKKRSATNEKQLKATVKKLRSEVDRADAKAERYKKKADRLQKTVKESKAEAAKLSKRLDKATKQAGKQKSAAPAPAAQSDEGADALQDSTQPALVEVPEESFEAPADGVAADSGSQEAAVEEAQDAPDESWTVVQLRAEARSRGLTGMSNKSKAQLLDALAD